MAKMVRLSKQATMSPRPLSMFRLSSFVSLLSLCLTVATGPAFAAGRSPRNAPDFTLPARSGTASLHDLRGKVVLVDFWASWCIPCRQSFPWMASMRERYAAQGLEIVAINLDKKRDAADAFLGLFQVAFTVAFDPAGQTAEAFHVEGMPSSFIVSRTGEIVASHIGFQQTSAEKVEAEIKEALSR
jgi:cytochrome c biogenesis protein CcmG, thiol:disulfide interchange protein DsbE